MDAKNKGFTLVELVASLALAALLAALAVPSMASLHAAYRGAAATSELTTALAYGRITAVARNEPVTLCPSPDGLRCSGGTDWSMGWIAYSDPGRNEQPIAAGAVLLAGTAPPGVRLNSSSGRRYVRFQPDGWASGTNLTVNVCTASRPWGRVILNNAGRARVERGVANCRQA